MIVVGCTLTTYAVVDPSRRFLWESWLLHAEEIQASHAEGVRYFCAIEVDARGPELFKPLTDRLDQLGGEYWFYSLDDGRTQITGENRGRHLCVGLGLVADYAMANHATHWLRLEADTEAPPDVLPRLLEVNHPIVAAACFTYFTYHWQRVQDEPFPLVGPPWTAACTLLQRDVFRQLRWRWDPDLGLTDDPALTHDAATLLNVQPLTRLDCVAQHHPGAIGPIDRRFPGLDMTVQR
jgi:hypothetical protein